MGAKRGSSMDSTCLLQKKQAKTNEWESELHFNSSAIWRIEVDLVDK